jgi:heterodisulfide reductase subunit C1
MEPSLIQRFRADFRVVEGLRACINCGTCTAICPAAGVSDYDPRIVVDLVQQNDEEILKELLTSDTIWKCGECLSCKTRCPRENVPGYIIQALRSLSIDTGLFMESAQGRKQLALKRTIGEHMLKYGYCVYIDEVSMEMYPEQGPVWDWYRKNREQVLERLGASYKKEKSGALRKIPEESMRNLRNIFDETGATKRFEEMEKYGRLNAQKEGIEFDTGTDCEYFWKLYEE